MAWRGVREDLHHGNLHHYFCVANDCSDLYLCIDRLEDVQTHIARQCGCGAWRSTACGKDEGKCQEARLFILLLQLRALLDREFSKKKIKRTNKSIADESMWGPSCKGRVEEWRNLLTQCQWLFREGRFDLRSASSYWRLAPLSIFRFFLRLSLSR